MKFKKSITEISLWIFSIYFNISFSKAGEFLLFQKKSNFVQESLHFLQS